MWLVENNTEYEADRAIVTDKGGERHWVVVVKGTFDILPDGTTRPAQEQVPVMMVPLHRGDEATTSLAYDTDLQLAKPRTDVLVNGSAYAPGGRPSTRVNVGLSTPLGTKTLTVTGDRMWERDLVGGVVATPPLPFVTMPIVYERAWGGHDQTDPDPTKHKLDPRNPVGTGVVSKLGHRVGMRLPNIELPGKDGEQAGPAGFGALCGHWHPRTRWQGTYDAKWLESRKPLLPADWDPQWLQCAPVDQQLDKRLYGGEPLAVVGMTPGGTLQFTVPKHYFAFTTVARGRAVEHRARIDTVIVEPDLLRVIVVWHSTLACHHWVDDIDTVTIIEKPYV
jgi:hypothetical protein